MIKPKQKELVMNHLTKHGSISSMQAFSLYHITRLAAVVYDLREDGVNILSYNRKKREADGSVTRWCEYRLA